MNEVEDTIPSKQERIFGRERSLMNGVITMKYMLNYTNMCAIIYENI